MTRKFNDPIAFKQALADRLRTEATKRGVQLETLRTKLIIERLLARLFAQPNAPWLLKGGYSFELRYRPNARTTKDVDLTIIGFRESSIARRAEQLRDALQVAARLDLHDHIQFAIGSPKRELQGPPEGGARFPVDALIAGKVWGSFHIDVGFGDAIVGTPEELVGDNLLAFAGIEPARVIAIPKEQQCAEKIHAYTFPWGDRENTRVRDLVDLLVLIERGKLDRDGLRYALEVTFVTRKRHALPKALPPPPNSWADEFRALAGEARVEPSELNAAFAVLDEFWTELMTARGN